jgi:putative endonuclease
MPSRQSARALGPKAERRVRRYYRLRGYRVLEANARAGRNELDIVLRRGRRLVFCEVKARSGDGFGDPREAVGPEKERRLRRAAEIWLARNSALLELEIAFEVVGVRGNRIERVPLG